MSVSVITGEHGPASADLIKWLQSIFGKAFTVSRGFSAQHDGIDLPAKEGTPVYAIKAGVVSYARDARKQADKGLSGWAKYGGNVVNIDVGNSLATQYAHLQSFVVKEGQVVKAGQLIGYVGRTGGQPDSLNAQFVGPHVHFGLWDKKQGKMVNPQKFLEGIGDTSGVDTTALLAQLAQLGIPTDLSHIFTDPEILLIGEKLYHLDMSTDTAKEIMFNRFRGKTVGDFVGGQTNLEGDQGLFGIPGALEKIGTQLSDTFTWIGFILLGLVLILGGIYLSKPNEVLKESA